MVGYDRAVICRAGAVKIVSDGVVNPFTIFIFGEGINVRWLTLTILSR